MLVAILEAVCGMFAVFCFLAQSEAGRSSRPAFPYGLIGLLLVVCFFVLAALDRTEHTGPAPQMCGFRELYEC
jgi:hypothetical protein